MRRLSGALLLAGWGLLGAAPAWAGMSDDTATAEELEAAYTPRRVAVLIGIQEYDDPALQGLRYAAKDAADLGEALGAPGLGGFDVVHVVAGRSATTAEAIRHAITVATADLQRDDTFVLYASGHGTLTVDPLDGSQLYLLPSDSNLDRPTQTGIPVSWLEETISELPVRRRVLILDTCHNGRDGSRSALNASTQRTLATMRGEAPAPRAGLSVSENEARLFAAEYHQAALEAPELENGVYTHFLIEALREGRGSADLDRDGLVDVVEAHNYAMDRTFRYTGGAQMPRAEYRITGREKIYLSGDPEQRSDAEQALLSAYDRVLSSAQLLIDGVPRGAVVGAHPVAPGVHRVELRSLSGEVISQRRVRLAAGTTTPLEDLMVPEPTYWTLAAGPSLRHGPAAPEVLPVAGELELSRVAAHRLFLRPEAHLRLGGTAGQSSLYVDPATGEGVSVVSGEAAAGTSLGVRLGALSPVSVGPQLELSVPWRMFEDTTGVRQQVTLSPTPGARLLWSEDIGAYRVTARYDARWSPLVADDAWTHLWQHGIAVGIGAAP